jgi:hypothetical protein
MRTTVMVDDRVLVSEPCEFPVVYFLHDGRWYDEAGQRVGVSDDLELQRKSGIQQQGYGQVPDR